MNNNDFLELIIKSQEKIHDRLGDIEKTQSAQHVVLQEHTRRSQANEELINLTRSENRIALEPIQQHVAFVQNASKIFVAIVGGGATLTGLVLGLLELYKRFF